LKAKVIDFSKYPSIVNIPDLLELQRISYDSFLQRNILPKKRKREGLQSVFSDIFPVESYNGKIVLDFVGYRFGKPQHDLEKCEEEELSYTLPLYVTLRLNNKETGKVMEEEVYLGDMPLMTDEGSFIINGTQRIVVNQLQRAPGVFFEEDTSGSSGGKLFCKARFVPQRGNWLDFEIKDSLLYFRINRGKRMLVTLFLRALGTTPEQILKEFPHPQDREILKRTFEEDGTKSSREALFRIYQCLRPGRPLVFESAKQVFEKTFFDSRGYNLSKTGRYQINKELGLNTHWNSMILQVEDVVGVMKFLLKMNRETRELKSLDHLSYRRVRRVGDLLAEQIRIGLARLSRIVQQRMSIQDPETVTPRSLVNTRFLRGAIQSFFHTGRLSQYLDQTNPLAELTHKRRLSALGPGGLTRVQAKEEVRDIHYSHYGRVCPIETPEGQNIGLIVSPCTYARVNELGFLETPYRRVRNGKATEEIDYLDARKEDMYHIAGCGVVDNQGNFTKSHIIARYQGEIIAVSPQEIDYIDVSPKQIVSVTTSLVPFLEHNDANRALMGSNMQRQAVPLENLEQPLIQTGMEGKIAQDSLTFQRAKRGGKVIYVDATKIKIKKSSRRIDTYSLMRYKRSNQRTCIDQRPIVEKGEMVKEGDFITDGPAIHKGKLSLGRNVLVAFMPWEGYNFEDAILISEKLVKEDVFTSIHIEEFQVEAKELKSGTEEITADIPNVDEASLKDLDENGIIRMGAEVSSGDILVGKVTPQVEVKLTPEEKLLRSIFGEKAQKVKDNSLRVPHGIRGKVIGVKVFPRESGILPPDVKERVKVYVALGRKISAGDKLSGRHGNKGVVGRILSEEDMPYLPDGTPVEMVLNPLGVPSRMNIGQIFELHLGWVAKQLGVQMICPIFESPGEEEIRKLLKRASLPESGKVTLYDGRTGEPFHHPIAVGYMYIMKLMHIAEEKLHTRSTGPYALITQQPLGGKSRQGGQRFGEMEVWALEGYGAAYTLQEMLTGKSDDLQARTRIHEQIIKGENLLETETPESLKVLIKELQSLGLSLEFWKNGKRTSIKSMEEGE